MAKKTRLDREISAALSGVEPGLRGTAQESAQWRIALSNTILERGSYVRTSRTTGTIRVRLVPFPPRPLRNVDTTGRCDEPK